MTVITRDLAKAHCRIDGDHENDLIDHYVASAIAWVENHCDLALSEKEITLKFPGFTDHPVITTTPVRSIEAIRYLDETGAEQTLTGFRLHGATILPLVGGAWPTTLDRSDVEVDLTVGYGGEDIGEAPPSLKQAALLLVAHQYENRESVIVGTIASKLPHGVEALTHQYRKQRV